jgi:hypothetical protein
MSRDPDHPGFATLLDWLEGRLDPDTAGQVAAHVALADERTRGTVDWLQGFLETARALPLHEPPPIVRQSLSQHFDSWRRVRAGPRPRPREVRARLTFDSRQDLALAGVRSGAADDAAVHLVYSTEEGDLLIDAYRLGGGMVRLDGQVLLAGPPQAPVFEASVTGKDFTARTMDGDELGRFCIRDVPEGRCRLRASNGLITIVADLDTDPGDG